MDGDGASRDDSRRRLAFAAGSVAITTGLLALVLALGSWAYNYRRYSLHDTRLRRLVEQRPPLEQVRQGLLSESARELAAPSSESEVLALARHASQQQAAALVSKRRQWAGVRAFRVGEMLYLLYIDEHGLVQDYALLQD